MLLQIDTLGEYIKSSNWVQNHLSIIALLFVIFGLVVAILIKRKNIVIIEPKLDVSYTETENQVSSTTSKSPDINIEVNHLPLSNATSIPKKIEHIKTVEKKPEVVIDEVIQKEHSPEIPKSSPIVDKIISNAVIENNQKITKPKIIEVKRDRSTELKKIGYNPINYLQPEPICYPIVIIPKPNSIIAIPIDGRSGRKGYKEDDFRKHLTMFFGENFQISDNRIIPLKGRDIPYCPDLSLINWNDGINMFIDIEIDEPYEGTNDIVTRKAIHYKGIDAERDFALKDNGWIVIRFAEIQVHQNSIRCCSLIADIISKLNPNYSVPISLMEVKKIDQFNKVQQWTKEEAEKMSKEKFREKYLGISSFGFDTISENIIYKVTEPENIKVQENITTELIVEDKLNSPSKIAIESHQDSGKGANKIVFKSLTIGNQIWMVDNLNVSNYRDGTPIPEVKDEKEWEKFGAEGKGCWCYCDNNQDNGIKDGKLYNWHAINNIKNLAPEGWRIPTKDEFDKLSISFRQMLYMKNNITNYFGWSYQAERNFNGVFKFFRKGVGNGGSIMGNWWSASQNESESPFYCSIQYSGEKYGDYEYFQIKNGIKGTGMAIRCVKDFEHTIPKPNQKSSGETKSNEIHNTSIKASQNNYKSIKINNQEWMVENLSIDHYSDGTPIREAKTNEEWLRYDAEKIGCWSYYNNKSEIGLIYGKLYNWYAVNNNLGLAPKGWHIPTKEEYLNLIKFLSPIEGEYSFEKLKTTTGWNDGYNGTNESGWNGTASGYRYSLGAFKLVDKKGHWWVSSEISSVLACCFYLPEYVDYEEFYSGFQNILQGDGCSVRCIKDY